jgi:hypothetical protein
VQRSCFAQAALSLNVDLAVGSIVDYVVAPQGDDFFDDVSFSANIFDEVFGSRHTVKVGSSGWRYLDTVENGAAYPLDDQSLRWNEVGFNDSAWPRGYALHGYGDIDANIIETRIGFGDAPNDKNRAALFRNTFFVADATKVASLTFRALFDDGAAVYINGTEVIRDNLPGELGDNSLATNTLALAAADESQYRTFTLSVADYASLLVDGINTVAVEVHQAAPDSSDLAMQLVVTATTRSATEPQFGVLTNDVDADDDDELLATVVAQPEHGALELRADGTFAYTPNSDYTGVDQFTYRATDGQLFSDPTTVRIVVSPPGKPSEDLSADGRIDTGDLAFLLASYGKATAAKAIEGDLDGDGRIGVRDAIVLRNAFTPAPAAAVTARAHDRAIAPIANKPDMLRASRRIPRSSDELSEARLAANDQALAASVEEPLSLTGRRSRLWARPRR